MTNGNSGGGGAAPPRPTRAGTLPLDQQLAGGPSINGSSFRDPIVSPPLQSARSPIQGGGGSQLTGTQSTFLSQPTPPLHHQPFSAPGNPYTAQGGLEKDFDEKVGLGMGMPMGVVEPREKELPKEPATTGRNRSGTGKSSKDKKSVFGVLSGKLSSFTYEDMR